jgi:glycosyltransferase involved in cell wall biosynthesis
MLISVPVVISTAHSLQEGGRARDLAYKATDFLSDLTTNVSQRGLDRYLRLGLTKPGKGMWVPNGLDIDAYRPDPAVRNAVRRTLDWGDDFVWLAVGNLREPKDYPTMLRAFRIVVARSRRVRLVIVGSGPLEDELRRMQADLGLAGSVSFLGTRSDVPALLQAADAFVMSSSWEGTPMALLEASAAGLPAVATDVGGIGEVIRHQETGFLVEPGSPDALAAAMLRMCALDAEVRLAMGLAARDYVRNNYGIGEIANRWEHLYSRLLALKAPDRAGPLHGLWRVVCRRWT